MNITSKISYPQILIGLPVYNGELYVEEAIKSLQSQTYTNWELLISDNNSIDSTAKICQKYAKLDNRIKYIKQETNIGPGKNFSYLIENANYEYFMWAACDDIWNENYLDRIISKLNKSGSDFAFSNLELIDNTGAHIKYYPMFANFLSNDANATISSFLLEPETNGKANIIYSVYRTSKTKKFLMDFLVSPYNHSPVSDMALVCGLFCRFKYSYVPEVLFKKRILDPNYSKNMKIPNTYPDWYFVDHQRIKDLASAIEYISKETPFEELCRKTISHRLFLNQSFEKYLLEINLKDILYLISRRFPIYLLIRQIVKKTFSV